MAEILEVVDLEALRKEVREKYREVAEDPTAEYHFHTVAPTRFDSVIRRRRWTSFPITPAKLLRA